MSLMFHFRLAGILQILLAFIHFFFPDRLNWREELDRLSPINRQIFWVHTFFLCLVLVLIGALSAFATSTLAAPSRLGTLVLGGIFLFWFLRLLFQWFVYDASLWRGKRFNTVVHILFTVLWSYLTGVYAVGFWLQFVSSK